jgi:hypothetical protein
MIHCNGAGSQYVFHEIQRNKADGIRPIARLVGGGIIVRRDEEARTPVPPPGKGLNILNR